MEKKDISDAGVVDLFNTVVSGGYCVGCGACAVVENSPITIKFNEYSMFEATTSRFDNAQPAVDVRKVCPFSNASENEDQIAKRLFEKDAVYHPKIGYYISTYAGYVRSSDFRKKGSSGGMGSWLAGMLLERNLVDGVIHVHQREAAKEDSRLFYYHVSYNLDDVRKNSKSRYYPIELSEVLELIQNDSKRYALIGVPCFIKAVRLLSKFNPALNDQIKFCVGLVCGHLKSAGFAQMLAWQTGIKPSELKEIDFRTKLEEGAANQYGVTVKGHVNGTEVVKTSPPVNTLYGTNWGYGFFKYKACDYCDDVVAETADVTIGDAWLPQYVKDPNGTNVVIVRNKLLDDIIREELKKGNLDLDLISADEVAKSQKSGFDHRREGLAYRLYLADQKNEWRPIKRIEPGYSQISPKVRKRQEIRIQLAEKSHIALKHAVEENSYDRFQQVMNPILHVYRKLYQPSLLSRVKWKLKIVAGRILPK